MCSSWVGWVFGFQSFVFKSPTLGIPQISWLSVPTRLPISFRPSPSALGIVVGRLNSWRSRSMARLWCRSSWCLCRRTTSINLLYMWRFPLLSRVSCMLHVSRSPIHQLVTVYSGESISFIHFAIRFNVDEKILIQRYDTFFFFFSFFLYWGSSIGFASIHGTLPILLAWLSRELGYPRSKRAICQAISNTGNQELFSLRKLIQNLSHLNQTNQQDVWFHSFFFFFFLVSTFAAIYGSFLWSSPPYFIGGFIAMTIFCLSCMTSTLMAYLMFKRYPSKGFMGLWMVSFLLFFFWTVHIQTHVCEFGYSLLKYQEERERVHDCLYI